MLFIPTAGTACHEWAYSWKKRSTSGKSMQLLGAGLGSADGFQSAPASLTGYQSHIDQVPSDPFVWLIVLRLLKFEEFGNSLGQFCWSALLDPKGNIAKRYHDV